MKLNDRIIEVWALLEARPAVAAQEIADLTGLSLGYVYYIVGVIRDQLQVTNRRPLITFMMAGQTAYSIHGDRDMVDDFIERRLGEDKTRRHRTEQTMAAHSANLKRRRRPALVSASTQAAKVA